MQTEFILIKPTLRIGSAREAIAFYVDWLGFKLDWDWRSDADSPAIVHVFRDGQVKRPSTSSRPMTSHRSASRTRLEITSDSNRVGARPRRRRGMKRPPNCGRSFGNITRSMARPRRPSISLNISRCQSDLRQHSDHQHIRKSCAQHGRRALRRRQGDRAALAVLRGPDCWWRAGRVDVSIRGVRGVARGEVGGRR